MNEWIDSTSDGQMDEQRDGWREDKWMGGCIDRMNRNRGGWMEVAVDE